MNAALDADVVAAVRAAAIPLRGPDDPADVVLDLIGDARIVLLGESTHGTQAFYRARAGITQRLIAERGFAGVAIEGDWPDAYRVNRFVRGGADDADAAAALSGFRRFPAWMWRNTEVAGFVDWLRRFNATRPVADRAGFYGLDLYSLQGSMDAVQQYLQRVDPAAAARARERYACFDPHGHDPQRYGWMTGLGAAPSCEEAVVQMLVELRRHAAGTVVADPADAEAAFDATQNAQLVRNAEAYYRAMYLGDESAWNLRDWHMAEALDAVSQHLTRDGTPPRLVVWAHNSHLGDARATEMGQSHGELNLGQLLREAHGRDVVSIGFTTHHGHVTAAPDWDTPAERMCVRPALSGSHEALLHATGLDNFVLPLRDAAPAGLQWPRIERAIGVIYRPHTERQSHYLLAQLPAQFDAVIHFDETDALEPLDHGEVSVDDEVPEAWPSGL